MKATNQTAYSWESATNVTKEEAREFANYLLGLIDDKTVMKPSIEISPKKYETVLNWRDAKAYCDSLIVDENDGWRLPSKEELNEIYKSENDLVEDYYWTSTETNATNAWLQNMANGYQTANYSKYNSYYVRPVRSLSI